MHEAFTSVLEASTPIHEAFTSIIEASTSRTIVCHEDIHHRLPWKAPMINHYMNELIRTRRANTNEQRAVNI